VDINFEIELGQVAVALVAHIVASDERVVWLTGSGSCERSRCGDRGRGGANEHAERQQEERERGDAREGRLELHGEDGERWKS
jgi:hypothetical protein